MVHAGTSVGGSHVVPPLPEYQAVRDEISEYVAEGKATRPAFQCFHLFNLAPFKMLDDAECHHILDID